jgi:hypothetical protein
VSRISPKGRRQARRTERESAQRLVALDLRLVAVDRAPAADIAFGGTPIRRLVETTSGRSNQILSR